MVKWRCVCLSDKCQLEAAVSETGGELSLEGPPSRYQWSAILLCGIWYESNASPRFIRRISNNKRKVGGVAWVAKVVWDTEPKGPGFKPRRLQSTYSHSQTPVCVCVWVSECVIVCALGWMWVWTAKHCDWQECLLSVIHKLTPFNTCYFLRAYR